jgi:hypothetical protein
LLERVWEWFQGATDAAGKAIVIGAVLVIIAGFIFAKRGGDE